MPGLVLEIWKQRLSLPLKRQCHPSNRVKHNTQTILCFLNLAFNKEKFLNRSNQKAAPPTPSPAMILTCRSLSSLLRPHTALSLSNLSQVRRPFLSASLFALQSSLSRSSSSSNFFNLVAISADIPEAERSFLPPGIIGGIVESAG
jgi:hypothetical protein